MLSLFFCLSFCGILARSTPYEVDIQADYLNSLLNKAKLRPTVKGELNFSPNQNAFSNVVRSVAGKRGKYNVVPYCSDCTVIHFPTSSF